MKKYIQADTETNYLNMTEEEWEAHNAEVIADFARWLDKPGKSDFEADPYSIFEKMTLAEVRKWLMPASYAERNGLYCYHSDDEVEEDEWYYILYDDGKTLSLSPGDSLVGVRRSGILVCIQDNPNTSIIYARRGSNDVELFNDATFEENFDIWRWDIATFGMQN